MLHFYYYYYNMHEICSHGEMPELLKQNMLHMQHQLCVVVIAESMGKNLKYTTNNIMGVSGLIVYRFYDCRVH